GWTPAVLDSGTGAILSFDDRRQFAAQKVGPRRPAFREVVNDNSNLADALSIDRLHRISPLVTPARFFDRRRAVRSHQFAHARLLRAAATVPPSHSHVPVQLSARPV